MRRTIILGLAALACVLAGAVAFALADHVSFWLASYWALGTATTSGGDVAPRSDAARDVAAAVMLTAIPLLGATFASLTAMHVHRRVDRRLDKQDEITGRRLDEHAEQVRAHVDRALAGRPQADDEGEAP